jgi:hypothetical protein
VESEPKNMVEDIQQKEEREGLKGGRKNGIGK